MRLAQAAPRVVLTYGRFDLFHQGHVRFLQQLSRLGTELIVGCSTDALAARRGTPCTMPYEDRRALLTNCRFVDRVIAETCTDQKRTDIVNYNVCTLVMGSEHAGRMDNMQDIAQVLYLDRQSRCPNPLISEKHAVGGHFWR